MKCKKCGGEMERTGPGALALFFGVRDSFGCDLCGAIAIVFAIAGELDLVVFPHEIPKDKEIETYVTEQLQKRRVS